MNTTEPNNFFTTLQRHRGGKLLSDASEKLRDLVAVAIRAKAAELATLIYQTVPESREQAVALTNLETAVFWANAGIARNE